ncbi:SgcJ/EcaC family oxidoreductase [Streptomyces sp. NPDC006326]|uniref:SgcJ/EcaC family oxidoreductase n=1 Tax=Streptomyces sp. NPDC006326 TaxID=3156752 RepID=UPI0033A26FBE
MSTDATQAVHAAATEAAQPPEPPTSGTGRRVRRRTPKRVLGTTALSAALVVTVGYVWLDATSGVHATGQADCTAVTATVTATPAGTADAGDQRDVCATLGALTDAWGRGDATAYGDQFTHDASYTTYVGTHYQGRRDIADAHRALFDGFVKGTRLADSFLSLRFYGPDTAVITSRGDTYDAAEPASDELTKTQTYTLVRENDGHWRIAAFHNTERQNVLERISFLWSPATRPEAEK